MPTQPESICILDDNASVRHSIERLLDSDGLKAQCFEDAEDFLAHARSHAVPVAVLDVQMPGMDGWTLAAAIKSRPGPCRNAVDHLDLSGAIFEPGGIERSRDRRLPGQTGQAIAPV